jgi:hypothetical protein
MWRLHGVQLNNHSLHSPQCESTSNIFLSARTRFDFYINLTLFSPVPPRSIQPHDSEQSVYRKLGGTASVIIAANHI